MKSLVAVPNDATENIIFSSFVEGERNGGVLGDEIVNLVLKFGEHRAWDLLNELIKLGTVLESDTCNALLTGFARQDNFNRMNGLMAKMVEMDIQPNVVTYGILIYHMCKLKRVFFFLINMDVRVSLHVSQLIL